jgi:type IV pilus assembly protein PilE
MAKSRLAHSPKQELPCQAAAGFSLVELMVVVAICAILASVAIPAYVNYTNRAKQTEAMNALMQAKFDQEVFWADNPNTPKAYANTIGCLASFGSNCANATWITANSYRLSVATAGSLHFRITAQKTVLGLVDRLHVADTVERPMVDTPSALKWSLFTWIFG